MIRLSLLAVLLALASSTRIHGQQSRAQFVLDREKSQVLRHDANSKTVWSVSFNEEIGGVRPPHLVWDKDRVYFTHQDGVTALATENGKRLWHTKGPERGLLLSDRLLLGTGALRNKDGSFSHWLFACDKANGTIVFKTQLAADMSDPKAVDQVAGLYLVQIGEEPGGKGDALLIDRQGVIRHRLDRQVITGKMLGRDLLLLTSQNIVRVTGDDKPVWKIPFDRPEWIAGGDLMELPGGEMIGYEYGNIRDSGVWLIRFDALSGKEIWKHYCQGLRVGHSKYSHSATVAIEGDKLRVTSNASGGMFVQVLDLKTGRSIERTQTKRW